MYWGKRGNRWVELFEFDPKSHSTIDHTNYVYYKTYIKGDADKAVMLERESVDMRNFTYLSEYKMMKLHPEYLV